MRSVTLRICSKFRLYFLNFFTEAAKKILIAGPLGGGGGVKAWPLRIFFLLFCCHFKIKINLLSTTYRNMDISRYISLSVDIFTGFLQYFPRNWEKKKICDFKKNPTAFRLGVGEGGGGRSLRMHFLYIMLTKSINQSI